MTIMIYPINPVAKPRMTRADKYKQREVVQRYWAFKQECRLRKVMVPDSGAHITFVIPMPKSWSLKKRAAMRGAAHQQKPDKDNLEKALNDALFSDDTHIWDNRVTKRWGDTGLIVVETLAYEPEEFAVYEARP